MNLPPPAFHAGENLPVPPVVDPTTTDWYVFDHDDQRQGPFTIFQLIEFAKHGQIALETLVWHAIASQGEWVTVSRVPMVASYLIASNEPIAAPKTAPTIAVRPWKKIYRRKSGFNFARDVVAPGVALCFLFFAYQRYTGSQLQLSAIQQWLSKPPPIPAKETSLVGPVEPLRRPPATLPRITRPPNSARVESSPTVRSTPPAYEKPRPLNDGNLGALLLSETERAKEDRPAVKTESIAMNLESGRQIVELISMNEERPIKLAGANGFPQSMIIDSPSDQLSPTVPTRVLPFGDESIYLVVKLIAGSEHPRASIECKTSLDWIGGDSLSADRLKRKRVAMMKQLNVLNNNHAAAAGTIARLTLFVESEGLKKLDDVKAARNQIRVLSGTVAGLDSQIKYASSQLSQFDNFCQTLDSSFSNVQIVFEQAIDDVAME